jgi:hypothetical protein
MRELIGTVSAGVIMSFSAAGAMAQDAADII